MPDEPTPIAIAVVERDGEFLIGERPPGKPLAGYAEFPGGRVEPGEAPEQAAVRECQEETGLRVVVVGRYEKRQYEYPHGRVQLHFFACRTTEPEKTPSSPFRWVSRADLAALEFPEANRDLLSLLLGPRIP